MKKYLSKVLRIIVAFCIVVSMSFQLGACSNKTGVTTVELPNKQDMFNQIDEYKAQAKFTSAIELYRQMKEYDYISDKDLEFYENQYVINSFICCWAESTISYLKEDLKDPHSLVVYGIKTEMLDDGKERDDVVITVTLDYGAKNSFGGMVRDNYTRHYNVSVTLDNWDKVEYAVKNHELNKESQFDAIINGTAEYNTGAKHTYLT